MHHQRPSRPACACGVPRPRTLSPEVPLCALPALRAFSKPAPDAVTVSGISSGALFAHQFHVTYSDLVHGAAMMAGGPYACAEQGPAALTFSPFASTIVALGVCSRIGRDAIMELVASALAER